MIFNNSGILTSVDSDKHMQSHFKLRNSKCCSEIAGRTYHIVGNLMLRLSNLNAYAYFLEF